MERGVDMEGDEASDGPGHEAGGHTVAFDVVGTLFTFDRPGVALRERGAVGAVELWVSSTLRDYFAFSHAGGYRPLKDFLEAALTRLAAKLRLEVDREQREQVMEAMASLDPAPGATEAVEAFAEAGWRIIAVTNGSEDMTRQLLDRAGVAARFARVLSCDDLGTSKPHARVYDAAKSEAVGDLWLVAAHAWDTAGALGPVSGRHGSPT
jgi:2-haloacid dehalogenase